jgi:hypothetical protein
MCVHFDKRVPKQCLEDDAEEVFEKERANFCDWFSPANNAFDSRRAQQSQRAQSALSALFGEGDAAESAADDALKRAQELFK